MFIADSCDLARELTFDGFVSYFSLSADGEYIFAMCPGSIFLWKASDPAASHRIIEKIEWSWYRPCTAYSADSTRLAMNLSYGTIDVWDVRDGHRIQQTQSVDYHDMD